MTIRCEVIADKVNLTFCLTFDLANNRLCPVHNIQAYFASFPYLICFKILTLVELFKVKDICGAAFHKLKYEPSLKSL